ncbi:hypothetical protein [Plantibacter sp. YIM 135347]|uniref:ApeA N-terminal domain 1-containing protein n=1 Tax=Plantibacter sp. YIM 135347 TaxID=3423919 RepID=UPI003D3499B5
MDKEMVPDEKHSAVFIHTADETQPYVVGAVWLDSTVGVVGEIPCFMGVAGQFETVHDWFFRKLPSNVVFRSERVRGTLFSCHQFGWSERGHISIGKLRAGEAVLAERIGPLEDELRVAVFASRMDGLAEWTNLSSVGWEGEFVGEGAARRRRVTYTIERSDGLTWYQGGARMTLTTEWSPNSNSPDGGVYLDDAVVLKSKFSTPRPISEHLAEQWKFRALLQFVYGIPAAFRGHRIRDSRFPSRRSAGKTVDVETAAAICEGTVEEHSRPLLRRDALNWPILDFEKLSAQTLSRWARNYDEWQRAVLPTSAVLRRSDLFAEDRVISGSMSIEALGQLLGEADGERDTYGKSKRATVATAFYRTLAFVGVDATAVASKNSHLAWALANVYNRTKHADRGDFPEGPHLLVAGPLTLMLVRLAVLKMLVQDARVIDQFVSGWGFRQLFSDMNSRGVRADESGNFVTED